MWQRLRYFTSVGEVIVFGQMILLWLCLPFLLLFPLERVIRLLTPSPGTSSGSLPPQKIMRLAGYWFSRKPVAAWNSCLKKSLVLYYVLNRHGIPVRFCLGVKKESDRVIGHSWLASAQGIIGDQQEFVVMYTYPAYRMSFQGFVKMVSS
jgi:hypothetical protein